MVPLSRINLCTNFRKRVARVEFLGEWEQNEMGTNGKL